MEARTAAVEFDTRKSFPDDLDDNHIGLDVNSVYSRASVSLNGSNIYISSGKDIKVVVRYDGENLTVFVGEDMDNPVLSEHLNLSSYLPEAVYVGFSASTSNNTQLNCLKSWEFIGSEIEDSKLRWVWILVAAGLSVLILLIITGIGAIFLHRKRGCKLDGLDDAYPNIDEAILRSSIAPRNYKFKELGKATGNFDRKNKLGKGGFGTTHHSTKELAGTPGYMAPESILTGRATAETDVYAFGVLVLEVACGRKPGGQTERDDYISNIVHGLWELYRRGTILEGEAPPPDVPAERPVFMWPPQPPSFTEWDNSIIGDRLPPISELAGR
ncbi:hypothetical protein OIU85_000343 [Salix viminalis]|uniref:Protein kinase domain-containing protein n=1 Tax=Salix viminalis TaxID=40686 RepID=A0A9Q0ZWP4_SALVM|nr:hypothetical protein OIU85_000343 [Salix viminalis]